VILTKEKTMNKVCQISSQLIVLAGTIALVVTGFSTVAAADTEANAAVVVVVSDDIMDKTTDIARPGDGDGDGNDKNRSGLGDDTNPGEGTGTGNSPNEGTDNPNNKPAK
jgi:hypothetical protein